jgi:sphinganine-1-phosphate aldolase
MDHKDLLNRLKNLKEQEYEKKLKNNTYSGTIYIGEESHTKLLVEAYSLFVHGNPLHSFTFPVIRKFEAEIVSMTKNLLNGDKDVVGHMTSGKF